VVQAHCSATQTLAAYRSNASVDSMHYLKLAWLP
jgi:hypothetical protein